ncbi:NAD(P)H dehydrogenase (quinone) [Halanaerobium saccharolyticum]|uniref:NAD(P)H dehydrogenase (Quinone) n=1 Tax=Halanaerobium saccharolyticum TaxID=43595 RepID=A0A4R7ZBV3_9FIRM|nr:SDR family oxidoreductase [Halanaerobium saccharolyticum]RAK11892.1 NAD(P)H dehydrogenase (quinone) [Halanaerobium saccharolyticum]TDW07733.1 NAD(P)H dehydrogenase (quinone) [Halanaerobium saccharolyticum]TDX64654.1 NAD(P)H dehydrogenase (quinone) [Halanaerobium saccharolyticum]
MKTLVTGATGKLGSKVMNFLMEAVPAEQLAVSVRDPARAEDLKNRGVDVRQGDFEKPETLSTAFKNVDKILIISTTGDNETRIREHQNAVQAAAEVGVDFIAYTSLADAENSSLFLAPVHRKTEKAIKATGIPYSFLRNNWYLRNELPSIKAAISGQPWVTAAKDGKVGWALQKDYAEAAAKVLSESGHENTVYELSAQPLTQAELVSAAEEVIGQEIPIKRVNDEEYKQIMKKSGMPESSLPMLAAIQRGIREGALNVKSNDFEKLLGRPATPIKQALEELLQEADLI